MVEALLCACHRQLVADDTRAGDAEDLAEVGLTLRSEIDRTEYGINWNAPNQSGGDYLANDVKLVAELVLIKATD